MKKEIITEYGNYYYDNSIEKVPKFVLQCFMKFLGIEIRKGTSKKTLCSFLQKYYNYENKSKKKIPLHEVLKKETKESKENRLCGSKFTEKDWNRMKEKFNKI